MPISAANRAGWPAHTALQAELGFCMPDEGLRREDLDAPALDTVVRPGTLIRTSYGTGPYLVEAVSSSTWEGHRRWHLTGWRAGPDGLALREEHHRFWINDLVLVWHVGVPRVLHLFANNDDEVFLIGAGHTVARSGQLALF